MTILDIEITHLFVDQWDWCHASEVVYGFVGNLTSCHSLIINWNIGYPSSNFITVSFVIQKTC